VTVPGRLADRRMRSLTVFSLFFACALDAIVCPHARSMTRDGASITRLVECCEGFSGTVLVVKDSHGRVFGGFSAEPWQLHDIYYGSGECFVWKTEGSGAERKFAYFPWSGKNEFFTLSNKNGIAMGGGYVLQSDAPPERLWTANRGTAHD
jgi:hypothetical protein